MKRLTLLALILIISYTLFQIHNEKLKDFHSDIYKPIQDPVKIKELNTISNEKFLITHKELELNVKAEDHLNNLIPKSATNIKTGKFPSDRNSLYYLYFELKDKTNRINQNLQIYEFKDSKLNPIKEEEEQLYNQAIAFLQRYQKIDFESGAFQEKIQKTKDSKSSNIDISYISSNYALYKFFKHPLSMRSYPPKMFLTEEEIHKGCSIISSKLNLLINYVIETATIDCPPNKFASDSNRHIFNRSLKVKENFVRPGETSSLLFF